MSEKQKEPTPKQPQEEDPRVALERIIDNCLESSGYVIFCGRYTKEKDKEDNFIINFSYLRHKFSLEEVKTAIRSFHDQYAKDALEL